MKKLFLFFALVSFNMSFAQTVVPIADLRTNDSNGVPVDTGHVFTVTGIVTSANQFGVFGPGSIQDGTAGISIYDSSFAKNVAIGDSVTITSTLTHFRGLTQFDFRRAGSVLVKHSSNHNYDTTIVTISDIASQQWNGFEEFESRLIRINNVTIQASGNFASGTNYNISDATGTLSAGLRIDNDVTSIIGQPIPQTPVDLIGILGQYKTTAPYNTGYQLLPRFISDIVYDNSPLILNPVIASNITSSGFTVYFNTARNGNSQVKYGLTPSLELDSVVIDNDTTVHIVPVTNLQEGTLYYFRAYSTNSTGTSYSSLQTVTTASANPQTGTINVYFNFSVDTTVAISGNAAKGNINFAQKLIERINAATYSIDMALYSFSDLPDVANALIAAKNRGVKIRVVYENRTTQNSMQALIDAGIPVIKRTSGLNGIMHNKFFIFDARDSVVINDWLWTGSWNVTLTESSWENNVVEINDPTITQAYKIEFEEMWGSNGDSPNPSNAKFGFQKTDNTPHIFSIGGREVKVYFSPSDGVMSKIINTVNTANKDIYFALYAFTRSDIATAMNNRFNAGVTDIRGLIDQVNTTGSQYSYLNSFAEMFGNVGATMHHKYGLIDATQTNSNPFVITGSANWSNAASNDNDENILIIEDIFIANQYMQEFKRRYNEDGGTSSFIVPTIISNDDQLLEIKDFQLYQNYPNPFNPITTIRFDVAKPQHLKLSVFDLLGREVKTLYDNYAPAGFVTIDFNANELSSGIYIYRLFGENVNFSRKMMLLK
ncbi:MAG: phospholipase D-like domain-containing protein [Ignavibacterium album]|uniref:phospholipase D-like domain-containing protein n=1 Tax=Ignavibacterium album TaxID=591197 RepID=UPI0026EA84B8|nr:phospholipase D-like domain-containing protein [Ignavibacterium album]MCX8107006.1 phospholipase D-like domain-containing protein [Ignavibacterium album]